eukprot:3222510-Amphidinium_carterae.1
MTKLRVHGCPGIRAALQRYFFKSNLVQPSEKQATRLTPSTTEASVPPPRMTKACWVTQMHD